MDKKRFGIQAASTLLHNANFKGFFTGKLYQGAVKQVCVPGLNCYSCPGAVGACPIGSLQSFLASRPIRFPYYVVGLLVFFGALLGRAVCGFLCPFGWTQELINMLPFPIKRNRFKADRPLRRLKYIILALLLALPLIIPRVPFFCKYICPAGTAAGLLLAAGDRLIRPLLGGIFAWKAALLALLVLLCLVIWRPFCKYICPLGAIYGFFNRFALYRLTLDADKCVACKGCAAVCRMCIDPSAEPNSAECIRCGDCARACPNAAISIGFQGKQSAQGGRRDSSVI